MFGVTITMCFLVSDAKAALYKELWHACVGPLVMVPREAKHVFYFLQGHAGLRSTTQDPLSGHQRHAQGSNQRLIISVFQELSL